MIWKRRLVLICSRWTLCSLVSEASAGDVFSSMGGGVCMTKQKRRSSTKRGGTPAPRGSVKRFKTQTPEAGSLHQRRMPGGQKKYTKTDDHRGDGSCIRVPVSRHHGTSCLFTPTLRPSRIMAGYSKDVDRPLGSHAIPYFPRELSLNA